MAQLQQTITNPHHRIRNHNHRGMKNHRGRCSRMNFIFATSILVQLNKLPGLYES